MIRCFSAVKLYLSGFNPLFIVVLETIVMIFRLQKVSNSIHRIGNKSKERNSYTVMSDNAINKRCVFYAEYLTHCLNSSYIKIYVYHVM